MRAARITLTVDRVLAADPADRRRTVLAAAAAEVVPAGVMVVDHGESISYLLPGGWRVTVWLPAGTQDLITAFYEGRTCARPVTFALLVPEDTDLHGTGAAAVAA